MDQLQSLAVAGVSNPNFIRVDIRTSFEAVIIAYQGLAGFLHHENWVIARVVLGDFPTAEDFVEGVLVLFGDIRLL
jgi:hypothetical protein